MAVLREGAKGGEVMALQRQLERLGLDPGPINGQFGPATTAAVKSFQASHGLDPDGAVGPATAAAITLALAPPIPSELTAVTAETVRTMFPVTPEMNIRANLPYVLSALAPAALTAKPMVLMALATIRAETEGFLPISEGVSQFNTSPGGHPFDLYDNRHDLGNQGPPDGERFRGRGFIQLTGRANYLAHGQAIGLGTRLIDEPELANDPEIAARLLASFLKAKESQIEDALSAGDLKTARRLVNGGSHGLDRFSEAFRSGDGALPAELGSQATSA